MRRVAHVWMSIEALAWKLLPNQTTTERGDCPSPSTSKDSTYAQFRMSRLLQKWNEMENQNMGANQRCSWLAYRGTTAQLYERVYKRRLVIRSISSETITILSNARSKKEGPPGERFDTVLLNVWPILLLHSHISPLYFSCHGWETFTELTNGTFVQETMIFARIHGLERATEAEYARIAFPLSQ